MHKRFYMVDKPSMRFVPLIGYQVPQTSLRQHPVIALETLTQCRKLVALGSEAGKLIIVVFSCDWTVHNKKS